MHNTSQFSFLFLLDLIIQNVKTRDMEVVPLTEIVWILDIDTSRHGVLGLEDDVAEGTPIVPLIEIVVHK